MQFRQSCRLNRLRERRGAHGLYNGTWDNKIVNSEHCRLCFLWTERVPAQCRWVCGKEEISLTDTHSVAETIAHRNDYISPLPERLVKALIVVLQL